MTKSGANIPSSSRDNGQPSSTNKGKEIDLYTQLWMACAGSLVQVPQAGDKVFYFPQGHIEQVEAYMNQDTNFVMPIYNLPSKILCKVVNIQLKAEANTDEVFAQITLLPELKSRKIVHFFSCSRVKVDNLSRAEGVLFYSCVVRLEESGPEDFNSTSKPQKAFSRFFSKKLTPSDTSTHGGFSVPKKNADECFPPLDMDQNPPTEDLVAKDLNGTEWIFRHIYRGQPKRHLITTGWSLFVSSKKLVTGDTVFFFRGDSRKLLVGVRRANRPQTIAPPSFISSLSMQHGILATAFHAMSTGSMFTVYYRPWSSPGDFLIPYDQYVTSAEIVYTFGMRFRMQFEIEDYPNFKYLNCAGRIIAVEDVDHLRWPDSDWRSLKVQWDGKLDAPNDLPQRVSPWNIELFCSYKTKQLSPLKPNLKRSFPFDPLTPNVPFQIKDITHQGCLGNLQGQETESAANLSKRVITNSVHRDLNPSAETNSSPKCMLFGVNIMNGLSSPSSRVSSAEAKNKGEHSCSITNRSCVKILKKGTALGRSTDLDCFQSYEELVFELDRMFEFKGALRDGSSGWFVTYLDGEGDMMLLGDCHWTEFRAMVKKIYIYPAEDADNMDLRV